MRVEEPPRTLELGESGRFHLLAIINSTQILLRATPFQCVHSRFAHATVRPEKWAFWCHLCPPLSIGSGLILGQRGSLGTPVWSVRTKAHLYRGCLPLRPSPGLAQVWRREGPVWNPATALPCQHLRPCGGSSRSPTHREALARPPSKVHRQPGLPLKPWASPTLRSHPRQSLACGGSF